MTTSGKTRTPAQHGIIAAKLGAATNILLAAVKIGAGVAGHSYALVADGIESLADVASSLIVWGGIAVGARPPDTDHPYGHGKAESLSAAAVSLMLFMAAIGIALQAIGEIRTPHRFPASWTLGVLVAVVVVKAVLAHRVDAISVHTGSPAVGADALHHLSDAITSAAAFVGIAAALLGRHFGGGPQWASADDWGALIAAVVVARNGTSMFMVATNDLMDKTPGDDLLQSVRISALDVEGVRRVEKLLARRAGAGYRVIVHIQADPNMSLAEAHALGGRVNRTIHEAHMNVQNVLVHMEPYEPDRS